LRIANKDARRTINRERVNALVHYEIDGETGAHVLKLEEYGTTEDAKWILLQAEAEPNAMEGAGEESDASYDANVPEECPCNAGELADLLASESESDADAE